MSEPERDRGAGEGNRRDNRDIFFPLFEADAVLLDS
jgi:hypothetical protein